MGNGVQLTGPVKPLASASPPYPVHFPEDGAGGLRTVQGLADRNAILSAFLQEGMRVYVKDDGNTYRLTADLTTWVVDVPPGGSLPTVGASDNGDLLQVVGGVWAKSAPNFAITGFTHAPTLVLIGATVATPAFTASYSQTPDSATLTDDQGTAAKNVTSTPTAFSSLASFVKSVYGSVVNFFLNATRASTNSPQAVTSIVWGQNVYTGSAADPGGAGYTAGFIQGLGTTTLKLGAAGTYAYNATAGQSAFFAARTGFGLTVANFFVNGFPFACSRVATNVAVTVNGVTENFDLFRSDNAGLGSFNLVNQ